MSSVLFVLVGFGGLLLGGEILVRGAVRIATAMHLSPMVIGVTLVGFGTSMPELVTSLEAAFAGSSGIAIGNVVGSNIANILLILGVAALVRSFPTSSAPMRRDAITVFVATGAIVAILLGGDVSRLAGGVLAVGLVIYLVQSMRAGAIDTVDPVEAPLTSRQSVQAAFLFLAGLALTILGAKFLVHGAISLAEMAGVSQAVIGLTVVAVGTSLPELVTSVIAALRGRSDLALGNVIGSNIFNLLGILGITAMIRPMTAPPQIVGFDIWVLSAATMALLAIIACKGRISRGSGAALLAAYGAYIATMLFQA